MNLANWLARRARLSPDRAALFTGGKVAPDYAGFAARPPALARRLRAEGRAPARRRAAPVMSVASLVMSVAASCSSPR